MRLKNMSAYKDNNRLHNEQLTSNQNKFITVRLDKIKMMNHPLLKIPFLLL